MSFLRSRHEQLTDHLREQIQRGKLIDPLPNARDWAAQLGVSCTTLYSALHVLARDGLVRIHPRKGVSINTPQQAPSAVGPRIVRLVYRGADYPELAINSPWWGLFSQRLQPHGIQFNIEKCTDARLRQLCADQPVSSGSRRELFLLRSLSDHYQRLFWRAGKPSLVIGYPAPDVTLPYVTCDLTGAIRHATNAFISRGFQRLFLLINKVNIPAIERQCDAFQSACAAAAKRGVTGTVVRVPLRAPNQVDTLCRFAQTIRERSVLIVVGPVSVGAVATTLLANGLRIPQQVEFVVVDGVPASMVIWPPPVDYAVSLDGLVTQIARAAVHYFQTGTVPNIHKTLPMELVKPSQRRPHRLPAHW